ncbi:Chromosome-partitioning ATPase Soj [Acaryochloris thomasi RCC1774]|uniref:Chromosome-partitioning ATPase Soj n=1 Tax=Acaryochloris thomasi RCC1774 TaxID=1764569 RepID=A0A2W1J8E8_9CYAN|nr:ParA family protein [Acaryochloris thomasi]PZD70438.1 Chromosome-partitioning ATPase Soj [Acaryochloris thomasi RCC1774]
MIQHRIAVAARKGGVGKTSISSGLASILSTQDKKVLLIDLDPQSNAAYALGVDPTAPGTAELLTGQNPIPLSAAKNLDVLPGGPNLTSQQVQSLHPEDLADSISTLDYDAVLLDCPPGNESLERLGIVAANIALVIANAHPFAIMGANRVIGILEDYSSKGRRGAQHWAIVMSQVDERRAMDKQLPGKLFEVYKDVKNFTIHQDVNIAQAGAQQLPLMEYASNSRAAQELTQIVQWFEQLEKLA